MNIASWNQRYETGIEVIDDQHRALFAALNDLGEAFRTGTSSAHVDRSLQSLMAYTAEHFETEERYMRERNYPRLAEHLAEHARLVGKARELLERFADGRPVTLDVAIFLANLLKHHIDQYDLAMARFFTEQPPTVTIQRL